MSFRTIDRYSERYRVATTEVDRQIEMAVIGSDWGANGYTTKAQADQLGSALDLSADDRLIDVGAGRGWPGLYLAAMSGCRVVISDVPFNALQAGTARAAAEGLSPRAWAVRCDAARLPFARGSFDAMVHTDVLC